MSSEKEGGLISAHQLLRILKKEPEDQTSSGTWQVRVTCLEVKATEVNQLARPSCFRYWKVVVMVGQTQNRCVERISSCRQARERKGWKEFCSICFTIVLQLWVGAWIGKGGGQGWFGSCCRGQKACVGFDVQYSYSCVLAGWALYARLSFSQSCG